MLNYLYGHDHLVAHFVAQMIPHARRGFGPNIKAIGVLSSDYKDGELVANLIAGMVYHNWDPEAEIIEMSGAAIPGKYWLTPETLRRLYGYPFEQLGCQMVVMRVVAENERLLSILARFNYAFVGVPRMFGRARDGVLCLLTREAWEQNQFNARHHREPLQEAA